MKNESTFIKCSKKRTLTAKALKFLNRCIDIMAKQKGLTRYHAELKPLKEKLSTIIYHLFIDKQLSIEDIKELIKNRNKNLLQIN